MKKNEIVPYEVARPQLDTFTLIRCEHRSWPYKWIGHSGVIVKDTATDQIKILESTTLNKFTMQSGVQMTAFGAWLQYYPGKVWARIPRFSNHADGIDHVHRRRKLAEEFIKVHLGTSYPNLKTRTGRFKLYLAALDFKLFGVDLLRYTGDDMGIFCTELVIMFLQYCELFDKHPFATEFKPRDLSGGAQVFEENVCLFTDYADEIQLK